jgi:hypothetical protein
MHQLAGRLEAGSGESKDIQIGSFFNLGGIT